MNVSKIRHAISEIERLQRAQKWLAEYGPKVTKHSDERVAYRPNFAGSCAGATADQRMAILGHDTERMADHYSRSADLRKIIAGTHEIKEGVEDHDPKRTHRHAASSVSGSDG